MVFLGGSLVLARPATAQQPAVTPEQLLAATVHADDLAKVGPGGWWDDAPEFNDRLEPDSGADAVTFIMAHVFGKPDDAPAEVATSLHLYAKAAAAADAFDASAGVDKQDFGNTVDGPKIGDQSRYLHQAADSEHEGGVALRFRFGRYLARIDVGGDASAMPADQLAALGKLVVDRLTQLDAGKLAAAALPDLANALPPADASFKPVLGTATIGVQSWGWIWSNQTSQLVVSGRLRALLHDSVRNEQPVLRRYGLAANPNDVAEVTLMPFRSAETAGRYLAEAKREDPRRAAIANTEGDIVVSPPIPDVAPAYRADLRVGRYVAELTCFAPFAPTSSACEAAVKDLAERVKKSLPAK
jgi:hypothetical protein